MEVWGGSQLTKQGVEFGGLDACVYSKPYGDARHGGDVYYASSCATGRISRLLLADVAGHPRPLIYRAARQEWDFLCQESGNCHAVPHNVPLGLLDISQYEQFDIELTR